LTTAKIITELHNGKIEINSEENIGTMVKITLPKKLEL
ncbi:MAG: ATP-binding protein, partial [Fusobacteria bacterium]|nr:ATP-binding protein [Fusobacteriota bacterium]